MKTTTSLFLTLVLLTAAASSAETRREIRIPDLPGFQTLVCDFHMHTVFSDGLVWPTVRVDEAWRTGLDAIALSDHIEYQPHAKDIPTQHNRSFELCAKRAKQHDLTLIRAAEITRSTPPGHFNAIFLDDVEPLDTKDFVDAVRQANKQQAFVFWNHHDWQGPEKGAWLELHQQLFEDKLLHGMEVANGQAYYPRAHQWCLEKNLTMLGNSDIHPPELRLHTSSDDHRTSTLVFATGTDLAAIQQALIAHRTAVWWKDQVIGRKEYLAPLFAACVRIDPPHLRENNHVWFKLYNNSDLVLKLTRSSGPGPRKLLLPSNSVTLISARLPDPKLPTVFNYTVDNFLIAPDTGLSVSYSLAPPE